MNISTNYHKYKNDHTIKQIVEEFEEIVENRLTRIGQRIEKIIEYNDDKLVRTNYASSIEYNARRIEFEYRNMVFELNERIDELDNRLDLDDDE